MKDWEEAIASFLENYDRGKEQSEEDLESLVEVGIRPMLLDHMALREASSKLAESNLDIFRQVINNPNHKMKNSKLYTALSTVINLTSDPAKIQ